MKLKWQPWSDSKCYVVFHVRRINWNSFRLTVEIKIIHLSNCDFFNAKTKQRKKKRGNEKKYDSRQLLNKSSLDNAIRISLLNRFANIRSFSLTKQFAPTRKRWINVLTKSEHCNINYNYSRNYFCITGFNDKLFSFFWNERVMHRGGKMVQESQSNPNIHTMNFSSYSRIWVKE